MTIWNQLPTIDAGRVLLRRLNKNDIESLFRIFSDPRVMRYWSTPPLANTQAAMDLLNDIHDLFEKRIMLKWGIALRENNLLIGTATLFNLNFDNGRAEIGYGLGSQFWGHGYMNEALRALINFAFDTLKLRRLEADVDPRNTGSIRTVERLGFKQEGLMRERWHVNGELQDSLFYGLLRHEWP
ncbi:MAG TPA: GNAT family N-acetyltransferase [Pyrinomonadaceae bacterium]